MKIPIQQLKSGKLFYNKWPYKIECTIFGAHLCSRNTINHLKVWCKDQYNTLFYYSYGSKNVNKEDLLNFINSIEPFIFDKNIKIRTEMNNCSIFCLDIDTVELIETNLRPWVRKISGPTTQQELDFLLENEKKLILCDRLPRNNFKYRVFFTSNWSLDSRKDFVNWASKQPDKIVISPTSKLWLQGKKHWMQNPFVYAKDDRVLSMLGLQFSNQVKKVEEFVERNKALAT